MSLIIGLTGGIASGKSTVSNMLLEMGYPVIDADVEARLAVEKGEEAYNGIVEYFGEEVLDDDGSLHRAKLGEIVFNDAEKRIALNEIVHPAIRRRIEEKKDQAIRDGEQIIILDIPLLFESQQKYDVDQTVLVYVDEKTQLERLMRRNQFSEREAQARIDSQMPLKEKVKLADVVINNNGTMEETERQLKEIVSEWRKKSR